MRRCASLMRFLFTAASLTVSRCTHTAHTAIPKFERPPSGPSSSENHLSPISHLRTWGASSCELQCHCASAQRASAYVRANKTTADDDRRRHFIRLRVAEEQRITRTKRCRRQGPCGRAAARHRSTRQRCACQYHVRWRQKLALTMRRIPVSSTSEFRRSFLERAVAVHREAARTRAAMR